LTVTGAPAGARLAKMSRTLNSLVAMDRKRSGLRANIM
jgi:hypothetical protein